MHAAAQPHHRFITDLLSSLANIIDLQIPGSGHMHTTRMVVATEQHHRSTTVAPSLLANITYLQISFSALPFLYLPCPNASSRT
ncbi:hypothetical protein SESBI_37481 [Sesbania bispinosa]|nr:hypothetical protein SESBI_37481 [Sesbania bispinosa]